MTTEQLKIKYGNEQVLCIPRDCYEGMQSYDYGELLSDIRFEGKFKLRYEVEQDEQWLQVIPYVVVKCGDEYFITKGRQCTG